MAFPDPNAKFRIQSVVLQTCIELVDGMSPSVRLRCVKDTEYQYWQFEHEGKRKDHDVYYIRNVGNREQYLHRDQYAPAFYSGKASPYLGLVSVSNQEGTYRLTLYEGFHNRFLEIHCNTKYPGTIYASDDCWDKQNECKWQLVPVSDPPSITHTDNTVYAKESDNAAATKCQLAPVTSQPIDTNLPGIYRIRSLDGKHLLTMPVKTTESKKIYILSQVDQTPYQQWIVALEKDGQYSIQSNGNQLYLGRSTAPATAGHLAGSTEVYLWDIHCVGGSAWTFRIPRENLSVGFVNLEACLVPSDNTYNQVWFMEKDFLVEQDKIHAKREVRDGMYFLRNAKDNSTYMSVSNNPWRIIPGSLTASVFELKHINEASARFTLAVTGTNLELKVAVVTDDVEEYVGLSRKGSEFVLLNKDDIDPGYVICLSDSEHPYKVVSGRTTADINENLAFALDNRMAGESMQMWILVPAS